MPVRPPINGGLPVPGWIREHEWRGTAPFAGRHGGHMGVLHRDVRSPDAALFQVLVARTEGLGATALALRQRLLDWDGELAADSIGAAAYETLRWALADYVARRSTLAQVATHELLRLPLTTHPGAQRRHQPA